MKKNKKSKLIKKTAPLVKSLGELMKDEDGFVSKETILKVGLSTVAALGAVGVFSEVAQAQHTNTVVPSGAANPTCVTHTNITRHTSY